MARSRKSSGVRTPPPEYPRGGAYDPPIGIEGRVGGRSSVETSFGWCGAGWSVARCIRRLTGAAVEGASVGDAGPLRLADADDADSGGEALDLDDEETDGRPPLAPTPPPPFVAVVIVLSIDARGRPLLEVDDIGYTSVQIHARSSSSSSPCSSAPSSAPLSSSPHPPAPTPSSD